MKPNIPPVLIMFALVRFALVQNTQAVSPPPDGGYPGGNTAEGENALLGLTTGVYYNTAVGWLSLQTNLTGNLNTAIGAGTLLANTGDNNTATGAGALFSNTTGSGNAANGVYALFSNTTGGGNAATGAFALFANTVGLFNTGLGASTLQSNHTGISNTAAGYQALYVNDLSGTGLGSYNSAFGAFALTNNSDGEANSAFGTGAMEFNSTGQDNVAVGNLALSSNSTGSGNTAIGTGALESSTGSDNVALGAFAAFNQTTGSGNVYIGSGMVGVAGESNACYIKSIFNQTSASGIPVLINASHKLGTTTSSKRFKDNIKPMDKASEVLLALKPVTFRYKKEIDPTRTSQFGLVAEDVEKVNPDLIVRDTEGKPYTVRYEAVNAMLLNEFLKEHRKNEEQQATIAQLKSGMEALTATVREQAAQIQKVSAQLEASEPAPQVVNNR
jgi:hypothetical protein